MRGEWERAGRRMRGDWGERGRARKQGTVGHTGNSGTVERKNFTSLFLCTLFIRLQFLLPGFTACELSVVFQMKLQQLQ